MAGPKTAQQTYTTKRSVMLIILGLFLLTGYLWWHVVYQNPTHVFWNMIDSNLASASTTRHDNQSQSDASTDQYTTLSFGSINASHSVSTVKQQGNTVKSETIGTTTNDYSRYLMITSPQSRFLNPAPNAQIIGVWGKTLDATKGQPANIQYFQQSVLSVVLFGNFDYAERRTLVKQLQAHDVYSLGQVKTARLNGHPVLNYDVNINPEGLITVLAEYAKVLGLGNVGLDPSQYAGSPPLAAQFSVDSLSHQLLQVSFTSNSEVETFSSQGLEQPITIPGATIPISELQARLQKTLQ